MVQPDLDIMVSMLTVVPSIWKPNETKISESTRVHNIRESIHLPLRPRHTTKLLLNVQDLIKISSTEPGAPL
jgi:hypothetical protein